VRPQRKPYRPLTAHGYRAMVECGAHNTGKNLNTGISVFLIYETGIPVLIPVLQKKIPQYILMLIRCNDASQKRVIT
jgi:hypothetical protein